MKPAPKPTLPCDGNTRNRVALLAIVLLMGQSARLHALEEKPQRSPVAKTVRVLTYNVQFLPLLGSYQNKRSDPEYRAGRIAREVSQYDIVGLQETFHDRHRTRIADAVRTAWDGYYHSLRSPAADGFYTSGGCLIMTRLPVTASASTVFTHFSKPLDYGLRADGFAAKGVIHTRIARSNEEPDNTIDLFVTHLEARADHLRPLQYAEMIDFMKKRVAAERPFLLIGDLNTRGSARYRDDPKSQYSILMRLLRTIRPDGEVVDVWPALHTDQLGGTSEQHSTDAGKRIDYIILGNPTALRPRLTPISIEIHPFPDPRVEALSDHNAVACEFEWTEKPAAQPE